MLNPLIVANWKCNPVSQKEARHLFEVVRKGIAGFSLRKNVEVVICPPFVWLSDFCRAGLLGLPKSKAKNLALQSFYFGAQDCFWEQQGAYTGAISPAMLKDLGCQYVLIGHSERRKHFQETDEMINQKIKAVLKARLKPILCLGEEEARDSFDYLIISQQIEKALAGVSLGRIRDIVMAYEPVWAIGTGQACLPDEAMKTALFIRKILTKLYGRKIAEEVRILYGGSVTAKNAADYIKAAGMDGLLVGGASLNATEFVKIVERVASN